MNNLLKAILFIIIIILIGHYLINLLKNDLNINIQRAGAILDQSETQEKVEPTSEHLTKELEYNLKIDNKDEFKNQILDPKPDSCKFDKKDCQCKPTCYSRLPGSPGANIIIMLVLIVDARV